jgi:hypothetical protein
MIDHLLRYCANTPSHLDLGFHVRYYILAKPLVGWPFRQILHIIIHHHVSKQHFQLMVDEEAPRTVTQMSASNS